MNKIDINLSSNQTFDYEIQFEPTRIGQYTAQLNLPNSTKNDIVIELKGNGVDFTASTSDLKFEFDPGKTYTLPFIAQIPDVSKNSIDSISVLISYNQFALNFEPFSIKSLISTNSTSAEYLIWSSPDLTKNGLISVTGIGKLYDNQRIELFTLDFMALLTDKHESDLNFGFDYGCTNELIKVADVKISEVCFNDNRILVSSGTAFVLSDPNPNPIASNSMVEYSVGFDVFTEIEVYNSLGELVYKPVSNFISVGSHSTNINTEKLSSGIYFMKMNAGPFSSVKRIIISK
jgi:hypothetical protein